MSVRMFKDCSKNIFKNSVKSKTELFLKPIKVFLDKVGYLLLFCDVCVFDLNLFLSRSSVAFFTQAVSTGDERRRL